MDLPLLAELRRRRVFRALVGYGIAAFAVLQIIEPVMHGLHWPDRVLSYIVVALALGFPVVVSLAWIFDVNAGRIERTAPVDSGGPKGVRLGLLLLGIGVLAAAPGVAWYFYPRPRSASSFAARAEVATPSIAVLPFADMSPGKDQEYFSDGIAEEILNALAQVDELKVIGRTSSFSFKGKNEDLRTIGEKLNVANVLEGSVRKEGNRVRVTAQLIEADGGSHLWSQTYDRELNGIFAVQDEIARAVVAALKIKLLPGTELRARQPTNPEAHRLLLLSKELWWGGQDIEAVLAVDEKVILADANYAPGWANLALALYAVDRENETRTEREARHRRALDAADRAVVLDSSLGLGHAARGLLRMTYNWDWQGARNDLERAIALAPADSRTNKYYGGLFSSLGLLDDAIRLQKRATELDPLLHSNWSWLGDSYIQKGQYRAGRDAYERFIALWRGSKDWAFYTIAWSYLLEGQFDQAAALREKLKDEKMGLSLTAALEHARGRRKEATAALDALIAKVGSTDPFGIAGQYAWRGEIDRAFEWLDRAYAAHDDGLVNLKIEPSIRSLRGDPRYQALLKKMNLPLE